MKVIEWIIEGVKTMAIFLVDNNEIFVIVGIIGMMVVITGRKEEGTKITSASFIGYVIAKAVQSLC